MSRATPDDQLKFLLNCVKHSNNGKIEFIEVAKECGIVSKGAAAKRYERLMKANGIHPNGGPSEKPPLSPVPKERSKAAIAKAAAKKKRKIEGNGNGGLKNDDDEDSFPLISKPEPGDSLQVKEEPIFEVGGFVGPAMLPLSSCPPDVPNFVLSSSMGVGRSQASSIPQYVLTDRPSIFDEFCTPELFSQHTFEETLLHEQPRTLQPHPPAELGPKAEEYRQSPWETGSGTAPMDSILIID